VLNNPADGDFIVEDVAALQSASSTQLSFLDNKKYRDQFRVTKAGAVIVHPDLIDLAPEGCRLLLSKSPYKSYALAAQAIYPEARPVSKISDKASIHPTAQIGRDVVIGDFAIVEENVVIGDGCWIEAFAYIGRGVVLGNHCRIGIHASVTHAVIGQHTRLYTGVRVGQDGFGFAIDPVGFVKVPQLGRVIMGDYIEVGANTTIDRGATGDTVIGSGTWIDNLVQIGHNVKVGKGCIIIAQVGIAGSAELEDYVVLAGQVGVAGHITIGSMARIGAQSGVNKNIPAGEEWVGCPAMPLKKFVRQNVTLAKLAQKTKERKDD